MSAFGDVVQALIGAVPGLSAELDGSVYAPVPAVGSRPPAITGPRTWSPPNASGRGQVSVHRDVLRSVAVGMRSDLADLDGAVSGLNGIRRGEGISITANTGLIAGWPTAGAFNGNASAALTGVMQASQQTGTAHQAASSGLTTSAAAYDQSESDNQRAVRSVGTNLYSVTGLVASYGNGQPVSSVLGAQPSYPVKTRAVSAFSGAGMSADTIMDILHGLSAGEVAAAGAAHTRLGTVLDTVAGRLATNAGTLARGWTGNAAEAAMGQFQQLHIRMATLAQQSLQVGSVLSWLGNDVLPQFSSLPDPRVSLSSLVVGGAEAGTATAGLPGGVIGAGAGLLDDLDGQAQAAANTAAQQYIARLSNYLVIADQSLPDDIGATPAVAKGTGSGGSGPSVPSVGSGPGNGPGASLGLTNLGRVTVKTSTPTIKTTGTAGKTTGTPTIKTVGITTGNPAGQPGGTATVPSTLQGTTLPGGQLPTSAGSAPTLGPAPSVPSSGGLTGGLPGPVPTVSGATVSGTTETSAAAAETLDDVTVPNVGPVSGDSAVLGTESLGAETLDDATVPGVGPVSGESAALGMESLDEPVGLPGISTADSPLAGNVIGGQAAQLDSDDPAGAGEATVAPDDMEGFPMMGASGAGQPDEQERTREAWLYEDDLWRLSANVVPSVIADAPRPTA